MNAGTRGGQRHQVPLVSQVVVSCPVWVLVTEPEPSAIAGCALNPKSSLQLLAFLSLNSRLPSEIKH